MTGELNCPDCSVTAKTKPCDECWRWNIILALQNIDEAVRTVANCIPTR